MVGMGNSARVEVRKKVNTFGVNSMSIYLNGSRTGKWLRDADIIELKELFPQIEYISPWMRSGKSLVKYQNRYLNVSLEGVGEQYYLIKQKNVQKGRILTSYDIKTTAKVALIGTTVQENLFGNKNPVGELILVDGVPLTVAGVLELSTESFSGRDFNAVIEIPYSTFNSRILNRKQFDEVFIKGSDEADVGDLGEAIRGYLINKFRLRPESHYLFKLETSEEKLKTANDISRALSILLAGIASISLFVGGVGIMNIMLVSVTERTREIGIRMAIGAKKRDIMMQFLIESVILSLVGGITGIVLGLSMYGIITYFVEWPFIFSFASVIVSVLFATLVGVFFGYYPAQKASALKPIEALRFE